jgi:enoyl-CoA hydratase/carnithine racemase
MSDIVVEQEGGVVTLRLNRPDKKNAITVAMYDALAQSLQQAGDDDAVRAVVILGAGDMFTAGNDLGDFMQRPPLGTDQPVYRFLQALSAFPKVVVAGVQGRAVGIGTTMLLHCDLVVAAQDALFSMPFIDLGLVPEAGSSLLFPRLVGPRLAAKHLILGTPFSAEEALRYGVATDVVPSGAVEDRAMELARQVAAKPQEAVRIAKTFIRDTEGSVMDRIDSEGAAFADRLQSAEAAEAFRAFFARKAAS